MYAHMRIARPTIVCRRQLSANPFWPGFRKRALRRFPRSTRIGTDAASPLKIPMVIALSLWMAPGSESAGGLPGLQPMVFPIAPGAPVRYACVLRMARPQHLS